MTQYFRDTEGNYIGSFSEGWPVDPTWIEVPFPPALPGSIWTGTGWYQPVPVARALAQERLTVEFEAAMTALQSGWPPHEIETWVYQSTEAREWAAAPANAKPSTPFLTALWEKGNQLGWTEDFGTLVNRVLANEAAYVAATARCVAVRQCTERALNASNDPASITWTF